jgi:regulatory protein YycI of two-component signal transduction system YycFG
MKRRLHIFIVLLLLGFQFSHAQDPNVVGGKSSVKMNFKKENVSVRATILKEILIY